MVNLVFDDSKAKRKGGGKRERESRVETRVRLMRGGEELTRVERHETLMPPLAMRPPLYAIITRILFLPLDAIGAIFHAEDNG